MILYRDSSSRLMFGDGRVVVVVRYSLVRRCKPEGTRQTFYHINTRNHLWPNRIRTMAGYLSIRSNPDATIHLDLDLIIHLQRACRLLYHPLHRNHTHKCKSPSKPHRKAHPPFHRPFHLSLHLPRRQVSPARPLHYHFLTRLHLSSPTCLQTMTRTRGNMISRWIGRQCRLGMGMGVRQGMGVVMAVGWS